MNQYNGFLSVLFAAIEFLFLINMFAYGERNKSNKIAFGIVSLLFGYQFFEAMICAAGYKTNTIIAFAFVDITFLPPLGLLLTVTFLNKKIKGIKYLFHPYAAFALYFLFDRNGFTNVHCTPFAAGYDYSLSYIYGFFYYAPIVATIYLLVTNRKEIPVHKRKPYLALTWGFVITFVPFFIAFPFLKELLFYAESLLCKLAFMLSIFLTFFVLLNSYEKIDETLPEEEKIILP